MLIDTSITIAHKCSSCGSFEFLDISCFKLFNKRNHSVVCHCGSLNFNINEEGKKNFKLKIGCIGCGDTHTFFLNRKNIIGKDMNVLVCPMTGVHLCFIGSGDAVRSKIDSLEEEQDELIDKLGYESYFKNTRVIYDALNRIHDIAEQGNLICECGNHDVELNLLSDRIFLECRKCHVSKVVRAASNEDLKNLLLTTQILLVDNNESSDVNVGGFMIKSDLT